MLNTPQQYKMALFNHRDILSIQADALQHNQEVVAKEFQPYNDLLFKIIRDDVTSRREAIVAEIQAEIKKTPGKVVSVSVPLWSYNVRYFRRTKEERFEELNAMDSEERIREMEDDRRLLKMDKKNGWQWTIGTKFDGEKNWDLLGGDAIPASWFVPENLDRLPSIPVDVIVRKTDLLHRLATTLFPGYGWVINSYGEILHSGYRCEVLRKTLYLVYSPTGLPENGVKSKALHKVAVKYATHSDYKLPEGHKVVLKGPGREPPRTPPQSPPATPAPPRAPRRTGIAFHTYTGPNAMRDGARDLIAGIVDEEAPCHCTYCASE